MDEFTAPVGTWRGNHAAHGFRAVGLFLGRKSKISHEQNVKEFQFHIRMPNYSFLGLIIKKYPKVVDPLMQKHRILAMVNPSWKAVLPCNFIIPCKIRQKCISINVNTQFTIGK